MYKIFNYKQIVDLQLKLAGLSPRLSHELTPREHGGKAERVFVRVCLFIQNVLFIFL